MNIYTDLTDSEFKTWMYIQSWRQVSFNSPKVSAIPSDTHLQSKLDKSRSTVFKALSGLRSKGLIN